MTGLRIAALIGTIDGTNVSNAHRQHSDTEIVRRIFGAQSHWMVGW